MKYVLRAINVLATVVIVAALIVLLRVVFTGGGDVPSICGYSFLRTLTGSMEPAIPVHSLVVVQQVDSNELQVGDVITIKVTADSSLDGALNTHRIAEVREDASGQRYFKTKGDANAVEDLDPVYPQNIVGRVVWVSAAIGVLASLLSNPLVFFPVIVVPLIVLVVVEVRRSVKAAAAVAKAEDEEALREAVRQIREKRVQERDAAADSEVAGTSSDDGSEERKPQN